MKTTTLERPKLAEPGAIWEWELSLKQKNQRLQKEIHELRIYVDKLAGELPCLPKDIEVLRDANTKLAQENFELRERLKACGKL